MGSDTFYLCIDNGDSTTLPADDVDLDSDGNYGENIPYDLAGTIREIDGNLDNVDTVDIGAFEFLPTD